MSDDRIEIGEDGAWYADWGERWESDEALLAENGDIDDWPAMKRACAQARQRIEDRKRAQERTPGTAAYRERVEAEGQLRLMP